MLRLFAMLINSFVFLQCSLSVMYVGYGSQALFQLFWRWVGYFSQLFFSLFHFIWFSVQCLVDRLVTGWNYLVDDSFLSP